MSAQTVQIQKEARQLLFPWTVTIFAGFLSLLNFSRSEYSWSPIDLLNWIIPVGCFFAIPLLAALPLGGEFQHGTFTLLLAQPVDRQNLWRQKMVIAVTAVLPVTILFLFSAYRNPRFDGDLWPTAVWIVASTSGSIAGTLIARSAIGGLALSSGFHGILFAIWNRLADSQRHGGSLSPAFLWGTAAILFCYAVGMVLLGRHMFLRLQAVEAVHGANDLKFGARFLPRIATGWLRSRPHGAILNFVRREFHLLRVVWWLALLSLCIWVCLLLFHVLSPDNADAPPLPSGLAVILSLLIALLAGSLSLGEEKTWGTHSWQLTMPISPSTQWFIKLTFALVASFVCAVAIPLGILITRGWIAGAPYSYLDDTSVRVWLAMALSATLLAFWCASVVKGTVRSVVWFFPFLIALGFFAEVGVWMAGKLNLAPLVSALFSRFDPFVIDRAIIAVLDPPHNFLPIYALVVAPLSAVILIQTHRQFREHGDNGGFHLLRRILSPIAVSAFSSFLLVVLFLLAQNVYAEKVELAREIHIAIETLQSHAGGANAAEIRRFAFEDLAKAHQLSDNTKRWLKGSTIVVRPELNGEGRPPSIQWPYERAFLTSNLKGLNPVSYSALIRTPRGMTCNLRFSASGSDQFGFLYESCH